MSARAFNRHGIRARAALLAAVGALAPLLVLGWAARGAFRGMEAQILRERAYLAHGLADHIEHELQREMRALHGVRAAPAEAGSSADGGDSLERATADLRASYVSSRRLAGVFLLGRRGEVLWEDGRKGVAGLVAQKAPSTGEPAPESATRSGTVTLSGGETLIWLTAPSGDVEGRVGAAGALFDPASAAFASLLLPYHFGELASEDLVALDGTVLASTNPAHVLKPSGHQDFVRDVIRGRTSDSGAREDDIVAAASVSTLPWAVLIREPRDEALAAAGTFRRGLLILVPLLFALTTVFAQGAARSLRQPLAALTAGAERIAGGDLDQPIPAMPAHDEVGRLGVSLEKMRTALARSMDEVTRANQELERRVAERTRELTELSRRLRERDEWRGRLLRKVIGAQEDERKRIARELHDETCQMVAALSMRIDAALAAPPADMPQRLADAKSLASGALDGLHRLIYDLRPSVLDDLGLFAAIRWYAARQLEPLGVSVRCEVEGEERRLPVEMETAVFRIVQEALTNVARHSKAETVLIQIALTWDRLAIEVEDDGAGFDPAETASPSPTGRGLGLLGMRERVELLGGTLQLDSSPGHGTRLALSIPVPKEEPR